jgi:hypothetical protein
VLEDGVDGKGFPGVDRFQQRDFEEDALGSRVADAAFGGREDIEDLGQDVRIEPLRLLDQRPELVVAHLQDGSVPLGDSDKEEVSEVSEKVAQQPAEILAAAGEGIEIPEHGRGIGSEDGSREVAQL